MDLSSTLNRQDIACVRCRERKVRCGREKPACMGCTNDGAECDYSVPEKRVNHTKLLCRNFDRLEARLTGIEGELSWLTNQLKTNTSAEYLHRIFNSESSGSTAEDSISSDNSYRISLLKTSVSNRRVIRGSENQGDQYHGPGTLLSLCHELNETFGSSGFIKADNNWTSTELSSESNSVARSHEVNTNDRQTKCEAILESILSIAAYEPPIEPEEVAAIHLPPKQLLLMVLPQYFSRLDTSTDLFVEANLATNIERMYCNPSTPTNDAWIICFNVIILLVLGAEDRGRGTDSLVGSQFSVPFFHVMRAAFHRAHLLTTPKLINVQALALLSIVAERYCPTSRSCAIFAQACLLAKLAGLHQNFLVAEGQVGSWDTQERYKTYMSLHLRDKALALSRTSICWLPSFDRSRFPETEISIFADTKIDARRRLAEIQEQLYRHLQNATQQPPTQAMADIASIGHDLECWKIKHGIYKLPFLSLQEAEVQMAFLATRMLAYNCSHDEVHMRAILDDARACCLTLLVCYNKHDQNMLKRLQSLHSASSSDNGNVQTDQDSIATTNTTASTGRLVPLFDAFPVMAFFQLTTEILQRCQNEIRQESPSSETDCQDLQLLQNVHLCVVEVNRKAQSQNRALQVEQIFEKLLELIRVVKDHSNEILPNNNISTLTDEIWPACAATLVSSSGDAIANFTPSSGDMSWEFMQGSFSEHAPSMQVYQGPSNRRTKRPRTGNVSNDSSMAFLRTI